MSMWVLWEVLFLRIFSRFLLFKEMSVWGGALKMQFSIMFATSNISQFVQVKRKDRLLAVSMAQVFPL